MRSHSRQWVLGIMMALSLLFAACGLTEAGHAVTLINTVAHVEPSATATSMPPAAPTPASTPTTFMMVPRPPITTGKVILIDLNRQWLWAYAGGTLQFATPVTTGRPGMETPTGTYQVLNTLTETWFTSAWPPGSPKYFAPELVHYGLYFKDVGFYIHDASWRQQFGPGTNVPHVEPNGTHSTGSHGCVELSVAASRWLYDWAPVGTPIVITAAPIIYHAFPGPSVE